MGGQFLTLHMNESQRKEMEDAIEDYLIDEVIWQWTLPLPPFTAATVDQTMSCHRQVDRGAANEGNDFAEDSTSGGPAKRKRRQLASLSKKKRKQQKGVAFPEATVENVEYNLKKVENEAGTIGRKKGKKTAEVAKSRY